MLKVAGGGISGSLNYQGTWNASTNTPTLTSSVGVQGYYYVVSTAGTTNLNGITDWQISDWAVFNGSVWQKVDNSEAVISVNGQTGAVVLNAANVGATPKTAYVLTSGLLSGGGQLTGNVTVDLTSVPIANVPGGVANTTTITAGGLLSGGGNLASNVTISLNSVPVANVPGAVANTVNVLAGGLLTGGGALTGNVTIGLDNVPVANVTGGVANTVTIIAGTGLAGGGNLSSNVTIDMANTAVAPGSYGTASSVGQFTVDQQGRLSSAANVAIDIAVANVSGAVANTTTITAGTGLNGGGNLASNVTINLANTAVVPGTYGTGTQVAQITIDAQGRITGASNVSISGTSGGGNVITAIATITSGTAIGWSNSSAAILSWENNSSQIIAWANAQYAVSANNATILINHPSAPFGVVLPTAASLTGQQYKIKKIDSSANAVTVSTTSSQTIDNALTYPLSTQYQSVTLQSDGSNWWITAKVT
jgi:hypothetical protein